MGLINSRLRNLYFKQYTSICYTLKEAIPYIINPPKSFKHSALVLSLVEEEKNIIVENLALMPHFGPLEELKEVTFLKTSTFKKAEQREFSYKSLSEYGITWAIICPKRAEASSLIDLIPKKQYKRKPRFK